jgi:simple sugar transport system permease protein
MLIDFFAGPWSSPYFAGNTLDYMALLIVSGLASSIAFRAGLFNLGLEGQIYIGGLVSGALLINVNPSNCAFIFLIAAAVIAMLCGAFIGAVSGVLKVYTGANEIITTFLFAGVLNHIADYFITGPLRDTSGNLLATPALDKKFLLAKLLPPSALSVSFIIAILLALLIYFVLNKTVQGYRFRISGSSPEFALYGGIEKERFVVSALCTSGALGALAGFFAVTGTYGIVHQGFSGGLGWSGIAVALIAHNRTLAIIGAAFFYSYLKSGAENVLLNRGISFDTTQIIEAIVLIFATVRFKKTVKRQ